MHTTAFWLFLVALAFDAGVVFGASLASWKLRGRR